MCAGRTQYSDGDKTDSVWGDKIPLFIIGGINDIFGSCFDGIYNRLETDRRWFPELPAKQFCAHYGLRIFFVSDACTFGCCACLHGAPCRKFSCGRKTASAVLYSSVKGAVRVENYCGYHKIIDYSPLIIDNAQCQIVNGK
jgi:hypothetical protein